MDALGLQDLHQAHKLTKEGDFFNPGQVQCGANFCMQLRTEIVQELLPRQVLCLMSILQKETAQTAAQSSWEPLRGRVIASHPK